MLRKKSGLLQDQLAEHFNISRQAIPNWESEQSVSKSDILLAISGYFNITLDYLIKEDDGQEVAYPKAKETNLQTNDKTKWLLEMVSCIGKIIIILGTVGLCYFLYQSTLIQTVFISVAFETIAAVTEIIIMGIQTLFGINVQLLMSSDIVRAIFILQRRKLVECLTK